MKIAAVNIRRFFPGADGKVTLSFLNTFSFDGSCLMEQVFSLNQHSLQKNFFMPGNFTQSRKGGTQRIRRNFVAPLRKLCAFARDKS
jgi:hypothetical protein